MCPTPLYSSTECTLQSMEGDVKMISVVRVRDIRAHLDMLNDPLVILHSDEGGALPVPLSDAHVGDLLHVLQRHPVILCIRPHVNSEMPSEIH